MAHKKGQGSSKNGRDSNPQFRGVKLYGGQHAKAGSIIIRQCGTSFKAGYKVLRGRDDTLMALVPGTVRFRFQRHSMYCPPIPHSSSSIRKGILLGNR